MNWNEAVQRAGILLTRLIVLVATVLGGYLLLEGRHALERVFGGFLFLSAAYLILHHTLVIMRGSLEV